MDDWTAVPTGIDEGVSGIDGDIRVAILDEGGALAAAPAAVQVFFAAAGAATEALCADAGLWAISGRVTGAGTVDGLAGEADPVGGAPAQHLALPQEPVLARQSRRVPGHPVAPPRAS